jgi:hypothetical protein
VAYGDKDVAAGKALILTYCDTLESIWGMWHEAVKASPKVQSWREIDIPYISLC